MSKGTLQKEVFSRFLSPEELEKLLEQYKANTKRRTFNRLDGLTREVTAEDKAFLTDYFAEVPASDLVTKYGGTASALYGKVGRIASRLLYQNKEKVGL